MPASKPSQTHSRNFLCRNECVKSFEVDSTFDERNYEIFSRSMEFFTAELQPNFEFHKEKKYKATRKAFIFGSEERQFRLAKQSKMLSQVQPHQNSCYKLTADKFVHTEKKSLHGNR